MRCVHLLVCCGFLGVAERPLDAQQRGDPVRTMPISVVLAQVGDVTREMSALPYGILDLPRSYAARQDSLLNGLERFGLTSPDGVVRRRAVRLIARAGDVRPGHTAIPGIVSRLRRIYLAQAEIDPAMVRSTIRALLPGQTERAAAVALLRAVAAEPDDRGPDPVHGYFSVGEPRADALAQLAKLGEEGRAALREMHRSGEAKSPQARIILDQMAREGFPVTGVAHRSIPAPRP